MIRIEEVKKILATNPVVKDVDMVPRGHVRIQTAFLYPDGSSIDLFVKSEEIKEKYILTDFGRSVEQLLDVQVKPWESPTRAKYLEDALVNFGVEMDAAALVYPLTSITDLSEGLLRLGQASIRVADLIYTRRVFGRRASFKEEVLDIIDSTDLPYEKRYKIEGKFGKKVRVDYRVQGARKDSLILTVTSRLKSESESIAARVFAKWYDIADSTNDSQKITIYDDIRFKEYRDEDLRRLQQISVVIPVSKHEEIRDILMAA